MNRRGLFGLLAAPLAALLDPQPATAEDRSPCVHAPLDVGKGAIMTFSAHDVPGKRSYHSEWFFCHKCGEIYQEAQPPEHLPPLPPDTPGILHRYCFDAAQISGGQFNR